MKIETEIETYMEMEDEELNFLLENPQEIETGCERVCDDCIDYELGLIKEAIRRKELREEHQREDI